MKDTSNTDAMGYAETREKPPLGCAPMWHVQTCRINELAAAIERYTFSGRRVALSPAEHKLVLKWATEIRQLSLMLIESDQYWYD